MTSEAQSPATPAGPSPFEPLIDAAAAAEAIDEPAKKVAKKLRDALPPGPARDALSGTWLGHALHPLLTDVVIGSFTSATLLDVIGGGRTDVASRRLIGAGIAAYGPTALTGAVDWADTEPADDEVRRLGVVHAIANSTALAAYSASLVARRRGARRTGILLGAVGAAALGLGGQLGGHLSFAKGVGVDQTAFDPGPGEWTDAIASGELPEGEPKRVVVEDTPVLFVRDATGVSAIHDRCSHRGCSLADGDLEGDEIVCVCHGSRFDRRDGSINRGPATAPQPAFAVRESDGRVEIKLRG